MTDVHREARAMRQAVLLSARGLGTTSPNPPVGCVLLGQDGDVVGTGFHERKGGPHAEGVALSRAGERARGGTAVVTLEPCNHVGAAPACRQLLLDAGVDRVVIAVLDPTSRGGGGAAALRVRDVDVEVGLLADEARLVLGPWLQALDLGRPFVTDLAEYRDGQLASPPDGLIEDLRSGYDAVLLPDGALVEGIPGGHGTGAFRLPASVTGLRLRAALDALHEGGVRSVLLALPPAQAQRYLSEGLVDRRLVLEGGIAGAGAATDATLLSPGSDLGRVTRRRDGLLIEMTVGRTP